MGVQSKLRMKKIWFELANPDKEITHFLPNLIPFLGTIMADPILESLKQGESSPVDSGMSCRLGEGKMLA
jgi:hypothetical protein